MYITFSKTCFVSPSFSGWSACPSLWSCGFSSENNLKILDIIERETKLTLFHRTASHQRFHEICNCHHCVLFDPRSQDICKHRWDDGMYLFLRSIQNSGENFKTLNFQIPFDLKSLTTVLFFVQPIRF